MMLRGASSSVLESSDDSFPPLFRSLDRRLCFCFLDFRFSALLVRLLRFRALSPLAELEELELLLELDDEEDDDDDDDDDAVDSLSLSLSLSPDEDSLRLSLLRFRLCFRL